MADINITPKQAIDLVNNASALLVDVRELAEWQSAHIANAEFLPLSEYYDKSESLSGKSPKWRGKKVIFYCRSGVRSLQFAKYIQKELPNLSVYNLEGGILAWNEQLSGKDIIFG